MPEATVLRTKTPLTLVFLAAVVIANTIVFAQAGQGGGGQRGAGAVFVHGDRVGAQGQRAVIFQDGDD